MVTVDPTMQNQTTTSFSDPVQRSLPNDEFDLGIAQENPPQEKVVPASLESASSEENSSFDFNLDLPDSYAQLEESSPVQTNVVAKETSFPEVKNLEIQHELVSPILALYQG